MVRAFSYENVQKKKMIMNEKDQKKYKGNELLGIKVNTRKKKEIKIEIIKYPPRNVRL